MTQQKQSPIFNPTYIALFILWALYTSLSLGSPRNKVLDLYHISAAQLAIIKASIAFPLFLIWLAALYGTLHFYHYANSVSNSEEGIGFKKISYGLWFLVINIILPSFINLIPAYFPGSLPVLKAFTIITNYITLALYLAAFWNFYRGAVVLQKNLAEDNNSAKKILPYFVVTVLFIAYTVLVFKNPVRTSSASPLVQPTYFLNDFFIVLTIIIPYGLTWLLGAVALYKLKFFADKVQGIVYKKVFNFVAWGLADVIGLSIFLQLFSQFSRNLSRFRLGNLFFIIFVILLFIMVGYLLIARGAKELTKIETV